MKIWKKALSTLLAIAMLTVGLTACGSKSGNPTANTITSTYDDMVTYLTSKGYIAEGTIPVDINTTEGYLTDNTGGSFAVAEFADRAEDYGGLWLIWWDLNNETNNYQYFESMVNNSGTIVMGGGAAVLVTSARSGAYAIAFAENYAQADAVVGDFNSLPSE